MTQSSPTRQAPGRTAADPRATASGARSRARGDQLKSGALGVVLMSAAVLLQQTVLAPKRQELVRESETSLQSLVAS